MGPQDLQRIREAMLDIGIVRRFGAVEAKNVSLPETMVYIEGDNGGVRFPVDAVRAKDMAKQFDQLATELAVTSSTQHEE